MRIWFQSNAQTALWEYEQWCKHKHVHTLNCNEPQCSYASVNHFFMKTVSGFTIALCMINIIGTVKLMLIKHLSVDLRFKKALLTLFRICPWTIVNIQCMEYLTIESTKTRAPLLSNKASHTVCHVNVFDICKFFCRLTERQNSIWK